MTLVSQALADHDFTAPGGCRVRDVLYRAIRETLAARLARNDRMSRLLIRTLPLADAVGVVPGPRVKYGKQ